MMMTEMDIETSVYNVHLTRLIAREDFIKKFRCLIHEIFFFFLFFFSRNTIAEESRDGSVGIALGYGLDDRGSRVRFPVGAGNSSLHHRVQNGSGAYLASYPMGTRGSFPGGKAAGT
jgi:hypothetical protein